MKNTATHYVKINNFSYFYKESGQGDSVVLLHGNPDSADLWDEVVTHLNPHFHCITPDLPGFGRSEVEADVQFSLAYCGKWLADFLAAIKITKPVHLIVHDVGAFYGLPWATTHSDKVKSICITNTLFFSDYKWHLWGRIWRTPILGELATMVTNKWLYKTNLNRASPKLTDAFLEKSFQHISPKMMDTVLKLYRAMSPSVFKGWEDKYLALTKTKPVLVIWGDKDPYIPLKFGYAERMANGQMLHRVADAGHWVAAEEPTLFANYWLEFEKD